MGCLLFLKVFLWLVIVDGHGWLLFSLFTLFYNDRFYLHLLGYVFMFLLVKLVQIALGSNLFVVFLI
jgi:hypothetical protein